MPGIVELLSGHWMAGGGGGWEGQFLTQLGVGSVSPPFVSGEQGQGPAGLRVGFGWHLRGS